MHETKDCPNLIDHCYFHGEDEPVTSSTFKVCFSCFHVFQTIEELVEAVDINLGTSVFSTTEIVCCPYCGDDFELSGRIYKFLDLPEKRHQCNAQQS